MIKKVKYRNTKQNKIGIEVRRIEEFYIKTPHSRINVNYRLDFYVMFFFTAGRGIHEIDFKMYDYTAGDVFLISKNQVHRAIPNETAKGMVVFFTEEFFTESNLINFEQLPNPYDESFLNPKLSFDPAGSIIEVEQLELMLKIYLENRSEEKADILRLKLSALLLMLNSLKKDQAIDDKVSGYKHERFVTLKKLIEANLTEKKTVKDYADLMFVSKKTINQITREVLGKSAKEFITDMLILEIKRRLSYGNQIIDEIAWDLGFNDTSYMTKFFKRYTTMTPSAFRRLQEKKKEMIT